MIASLVFQSYDLNKTLPNSEWLLYMLFCSPITTRSERK